VDEVLKRFIAIWRNTVAIAPVDRSASRLSRASSSRGVEHPPEHERLAEHRRGRGEGERRRLMKDALGLGEPACSP